MGLIVRTGIDMVKIARIADVVNRHGDRFLKKILSADEISICSGRVHAIAARWAAKEAVAKLFGVGIRGLASGAEALPWQDIEIRRHPNGNPHLVLYRSAVTIASAQGLSSFDISLSHDGDYAIACAIAIGIAPDE
ncbi:MAG: holo-ACP synthase [Chloroflexales bacterium]|nr:holo-ACP synthase [Chloroflexales bacterium]